MEASVRINCIVCRDADGRPVPVEERRTVPLQELNTYEGVLRWASAQHGQRKWLLRDLTSGVLIANEAQLGQALSSGSRLEVLDEAATCIEMEETISVCPKPLAPKQEVQKLFVHGIKGGLTELLDNSLRAVMEPCNRQRMPLDCQWAPYIWVEFIDSANDDEAALIIQDNGVGMREEVARTFLKMTQSWSNPPKIARSKNNPLKLDEYLNPHLSRYGLGVNATHGFGRTCEVTTREVGSSLQCYVRLDNKERLDSYANGGTGWDASFKRVFARDDESVPLNFEDVDPAAGFHLPYGTHTRITGLEKEVLADLRNPSVLKRIRAEVWQDYLLFLEGIPEIVRNNVPDHLRGYPAECDLTLSLFCKSLGVAPLRKSTLNSLPGDEQPVLKRMLDKLNRVAGGRDENLPFVLHLRYVPPNNHDTLEDDVEEEPSNQDKALPHLCKVAKEASQLLQGPGAASTGKKPGKGATGRKRTKSTGVPSAANDASGSKRKPAPPSRDQASTVQEYDPVQDKSPPAIVDMLLVLFNFPLKAGLPSKPNAGNGAGAQGGSWADKEPFIYTFWSGRLLPQCELMGTLPNLVTMAHELGKFLNERKAHKLDSQHLTGMLFLSPECDPTNHKTAAVECEAFQAFRDMGPEPQVAMDQRQVEAIHSQGGMHTYDFERELLVKDAAGALATRLLLAHFKLTWRDLDDEGRLIDAVLEEHPAFVGLVEQSFKYQLANHPTVQDAVCASELVTLRHAPERPDNATYPVSPGVTGVDNKGAKEFFVVEKFFSLGSDTLRQHQVQLRPWLPDWFDSAMEPSPKPNLHAVQDMVPLPFAMYGARKDKAAELKKTWEDDFAPHHLAFIKREAHEGGKASKGGRAAKKSDAGASRETTREPTEVEGPHKGGTGHAFRMISLFDQVEVAVASKAGKPITRAGLSKNFDGLHDWGRKLIVTLDLQGSNKDRTQVWRKEFSAVDRYCRFIVTGIREQITSLGKYSLTMRVASDPESGAPQPKPDSASMQLLYEFEVVCDPPSKLTAAFVDEDGQVVAREDCSCKLRLTEPKVNVRITLEDAQGQQVNIPDHCQPKLRVCVASAAAASSRATVVWEQLPQQLQPASRKPVRSIDKNTLTVQGFAVPGFSLGGGSRDARLEIEVATLKTDLHFTLFAAPCVKPVTDHMSNSRKDIAKGENLNVSLIQFKDQWGNLYVPNEREQVELQLSMTNIADSRHQQVKAHKVKLSAQGIAQLPVWRAMGSMGSSAKLHVQSSLMAPDASGEIICRKIFQVHLGFTHPGIKMMDEVEVAKGTQRANKGNDDQAGADTLRSLKSNLSGFMSAKYPEVHRFYKLDLLDRVGKFQKPLAASRLVSLDGRNTWRLQSDVLAGMETKLDHSLLRPTGERYTLHQLKALVDGLNTRIQKEQAVHEVVAVVRPGIKLLRNMGLQICRAQDDTLDRDWEANIKVRLLYKTRDNGHKEESLDLDDIQYKLCNKADSMPFALPLSDDLFEGYHTVVAEFADSHDQKIVYGRMYLRQVARPCKAQLLPIGSLFLGQNMRQEVGPAKKVRSGLLARADAPEANTTAPVTLDPLGQLAGWKLGGSAVTMDTLEEMLVPEGDGPLMQRRTATRLFLMVLDQFGVPIEVPKSLRDTIMQQATVTVAPTGTGGAGMGTPGPATAAPSARIVPDSWAWDLSIPVPVKESPPWSVPCFSLEVQVERGTGPALLTIHLQPPDEEAAGSSSQAAATQGGEGLGVVSLAVTLPPNAMRKDGYQVQCEGNPRVRVQLKPPPDPIRRKRPRKSIPLSSVFATVKPAEEGSASDEEGADATMFWEVFSPEEEHADLDIPLLDSDGNMVTARSVSDWTLERPDSLADAKLAVRDGMLRLALKAPRTNSSLRDRVAGFARGQGDAALAGHRLVLRPNNAHLSEVLSLAITVHVVGGSFLAGVMRTQESVDSDDWEPFTLPDDLQGPAMLARLPSFQVYAGDGSPWLPHEHAGSSASAARASLTLEWRRLPDSVQAAADPAADVGQLMREGGLGLVQQVAILENGRLSTEVRMPAKVGRWGLCVNNAALPCGILVGVEVKAGRPFSVHLEETGSQEEQLLHHPPMHTLVLRSGERQQANAEPMAELMPKLGGWLLDRHGNRADAGLGMRLQLVVRQPHTPDVVLDTSEVTGTELFEFTPTQKLAEIIQLGTQAREAAMQQARGHAAPEVHLPEYELVLVCSERRVELGHDQWEPLDAASVVQPLLRATLVEMVGSVAESKELNRQIEGLRFTIRKLTNAKLNRVTQLSKLQEAAQTARNTMLATEAELLKLLESRTKEQAVADWTANAASLEEQLEHDDLHTLDQRSPHVLRPWVAPERLQNFPVVSLAVLLCNLPGLNSGQVLGPVVCLGAVERRQVAMSLVTLAGLPMLSMVAVKGAATSDRVREFLERNGVAPVDVLDLEDINTARVYCRDSDASLLHDPQQCLKLDVHNRYHDLLKEGTNNQPLNFVGYAVNLVHLTPTQLSWRLTVRAKTYTLRQSLLWWLFRDAMVFETKGDINLFRTRSNAQNIPITSRLVALDGSTYNMRPGLQRTGQPHHYDLTWSRVPRDHQLAFPLDHIVRQKKGDIDQLHEKVRRTAKLTNDLEQQRQASSDAENTAEEHRQQMEQHNNVLSAQIVADREKLEALDARRRTLNAQQDALERRQHKQGAGASRGGRQQQGAAVDGTTRPKRQLDPDGVVSPGRKTRSRT